jgi:hypothetical protein
MGWWRHVSKGAEAGLLLLLLLCHLAPGTRVLLPLCQICTWVRPSCRLLLLVVVVVV